MCLANVYKVKGAERTSLLEEVALIRLEGEKLFLRTLMGEEESLAARIKEIDFLNSTVLLEED